MKLHRAQGEAETTFGVYLSGKQADAAGIEDGEQVRITPVDETLALVTAERLPAAQWLELYDTATKGRTTDEMSPTELVQLAGVSSGNDGRRPSTVTTLAQLGDTGHRLVVTEVARSLGWKEGDQINRRVGPGVVVLYQRAHNNEDIEERVESVLNAGDAPLHR